MQIHQLDPIQDGNPRIAKGAFGTIDIAVCSCYACSSDDGTTIEQYRETFSYVALKSIRNALCPSRDPYNNTDNKPQLTPSIFAELAALRVLSSEAYRHENVTPLLSIITESKTSYDHDITFVFPYCPIDLHQIILSYRFKNIDNIDDDVGKQIDLYPSLPIPIVRTVFRDILTGLKHIHSIGILHCDMKPSNLLLSSNGMFQLADFGLARLHVRDDNEKEVNLENQSIMGLCTLPYRPPEILFGSEDYQPSIDMWGAGLILCEMLSARTLFYGVNVLDTLSRIFDVLGTPTQDNWEGVDQLRDYGKVVFAPNRGVGLENVVDRLNDDDSLKKLANNIVALDPCKRHSPIEALSDEWMQGELCSRQVIFEKLVPKKFINVFDGYKIDDLDDVMKEHLLEQMKLHGADIASSKRNFSPWRSTL